jgi:(p)ppGpp synthase/HD superfamily hydrolase
MSEKYAEAPVLTQRFDQAMQLALDHHRMHLRKGTELPYVTHLLAVTASVLEMGGNEDEAIAALLHDAVEDGGGPLMQKRINWQFGPAVGEMVAANSDTDSEPKPPWESR